MLRSTTLAIAQHRAVIAKERERLVAPARPAEAAKLAARYANPDLGTPTARRQGGAVVFTETAVR